MDEAKEEKKIELKPVVLEFENDGKLAFRNQQELANAARLAIKINLVPNHLKAEGLEAVMSAMIMCKQFNLPDKAMNQMAYVKGKLTCFGSLVTAIAERHPEYGDREDFFIDENMERICVQNKNIKNLVYAAVVRSKKKNSQVWNEYFFSIDEAEQAGLLTKNTKPDSGWIKYTKDLLFHKANKRMLEANYASALNGVEYYEDLREALDVSKPMKEVLNATEITQELLNDSPKELANASEHQQGL